jgi:ERCC4-type nuclease
MQTGIDLGNIVIYADLREQSTRIIPILRKMCEVREKQLDVGDYILSERVCAERKTTQDFVSSIADKRLFSQLDAMKEFYKNPILIIEGDDVLSTGRNIHPNAIRGAIASIAIDYGIPILHTMTQMDTAHQMFIIAQREQLESNKTVGIRGKKKARSTQYMQEFLVSGIPKINTKKARALLVHFKTPEKIFCASEMELAKAPGIGPELARQIRKLLCEKYDNINPGEEK